MRPVEKLVALVAPVVSLVWVAPLALATWRNNDRFSIWVLTAPLVIGVIAYPGYAAAVCGGRRQMWRLISLNLGLVSSVGGLLLVLWYSRDVLASPRSFAVATLHSPGSFFALVICPAISAFMCVRARLHQR
jgi:hypothetical protein